jgi:hypothetical protein
MPRPTFINQNLKADYKDELIVLLKEYSDCFAWNYKEMPGLIRELIEHWLPIKLGLGLVSNIIAASTLQYTTEIKRILIGCWKCASLSHADIRNGSLILCLLRKNTLES